MKKILILFLFLFIFSKNTMAADYRAVCDNKSCSGPYTSIFYEINLAPALEVTKSFQVKNSSQDNLDLSLVTTQNFSSTDQILLNNIDVVITNDKGDTRFNNTLASLLNTSVDLKNIPGSNTYIFYLTFSIKKIDNNYQGKKVNFNLSFNLETGASHHSSSPQSSTTPSLLSIKKLLSFKQPLPQIMGEASPSADIISSKDISPQFYNQLKSYLRLWPWLILLIPFLWWIFLLYKRRLSR